VAHSQEERQWTRNGSRRREGGKEGKRTSAAWQMLRAGGEEAGEEGRDERRMICALSPTHCTLFLPPSPPP
jgi:hypothetical protein